MSCQTKGTVVAALYDVMKWQAATGEPGHTFVLVDEAGKIAWVKDYGAPEHGASCGSSRTNSCVTSHRTSEEDAEGAGDVNPRCPANLGDCASPTVPIWVTRPVNRVASGPSASW